jgi:phosphatidylinositol alpha-1,6-mannosyltransferase
MQNLMGGLANALLNHGPVKVFADKSENFESYDKLSKVEIERFSGIKLLRKYRKANRIAEHLKDNQNIRSIFFDHWKSVEKINFEAIKNIPTFCLIHSKEINHSKNSRLNKRVLSSIDKARYIIANSNFTKNLGIEVGIPENKIHIIHPGCDDPIKIEKNFQIQAEEMYKDSFPKIITVARLDRRKNHQNILMCIKNLKEKFPKIRYISIGDGEEKNNLLRLRKELKIEKEVIFLNKTGQKLKNALIKNSNLFLMPSISFKKSVEGFGISFVEAASYGIGSIGGEHGGARDAIQNEKTGLLCDGEDINAIYNNIVKFFANDKYKEYGSNALKFSENFSWNKIIRKYLNLI